MADATKITWGANDQHRLLNKPTPRVDGPKKVSGAAEYTYDVRVPGMLYGRVLRSPHARARVTQFDAAAALKIPGVKAVVDANRDVLYEGAPVAAVAAISPEIADDAIHAILVKYEVLPHAVKAEDAIKPDAPKVLGERNDNGNLRAGEHRGNLDSVTAAISKCDAIVEAEYRTPILHHCCLETHGVVVDFRGGDTATVYASTQGTFTIPGDAAGHLGLKGSAVTAIVQNMGGGFGSKFGIGAAGALACRLSKQVGAPVKLMLTRQDEFVMAGNGSGSWQKVRAGANKDGTLVAIDARQFRLGGIGGGSLAGLPYVYGAKSIYREMTSIHTNEDSSVALRAPGHPPASFAMESLMDELADKLGIDPIEFRKKNLHGDGTHARQLDRGAKEIGWNRRKSKPGAWEGNLKRGFGCAVGVWGGGGGPQCQVDVNIRQDGSVTAAVGTQDLGTGTRTYICAIVAEELGLELNDVQEKIGDSRLGAANGSGGSTTAASLAPAVKSAAFNARQAMAERIAPLLGTGADQVVFADRKLSGNSKSLSWKQACAALPAAGIAVRGEWVGSLQGSGTHGACFAEVEVDVETGHVRVMRMVHVQDVGLPLNRLAVESQISGGMVQGLGMALLEGRITDAQTGVMLNASMNDYKIPGSLEMPEMVPLIDDGDTRPVVIGVGEPPAIPGAGAIANAIFNACGVRVRELPITSDKILMGLSS